MRFELDRGRVGMRFKFVLDEYVRKYGKKIILWMFYFKFSNSLGFEIINFKVFFWYSD